jgi:hypothetical protein
VARKAAHLERAGALTPRDRMWAAIRARIPRWGEAPSPRSRCSSSRTRASRRQHVHVDSVLTYLRDMSQAQPPFVVLGASTLRRKRSELMALGS